MIFSYLKTFSCFPNACTPYKILLTIVTTIAYTKIS